MSEVQVLGLAGMAGAGKDFTCEWLTRNATAQVVRFAFADGVRQEASEFFDPGDGDLFWRKPYDEPVRHVLQWWGTDYRRAQDPDYWVRYGMEQMKVWLAVATRVAQDRLLIPTFTDVRFANEAEAIKAAGGIVLEVRAPDEVRAARLGGKLPPAHASEEMDFTVDGVVMNSFADGVPLIPTEFHDALGIR